MKVNLCANSSSLILYQTEDGQTRVQCRFENENVWLTQTKMSSATASLR